MKNIIKEALNKNPIGVKEALEEELRSRIASALVEREELDENNKSKKDAHAISVGREALIDRSILKKAKVKDPGGPDSWTHRRLRLGRAILKSGMKEETEIEEAVKGDGSKRNKALFNAGLISKDEYDKRMGHGKYRKGEPRGVGPLGKSLYKNLVKKLGEETDLNEAETMSWVDAEKLADKHVTTAVKHKKAGNIAGYRVHTDASNYITDRLVNTMHPLPVKSSMIKKKSDAAFKAHP